MLGGGHGVPEPVLGHGLGGVNRGGGADRECPEELLVVGAETRPAPETVKGDEDAARSPPERHRDHERRGGRDAELGGWHLQLGLDVVHALGPPAPEDTAGQRPLNRDSISGALDPSVAGGSRHRELVPLLEQDQERPGLHQGAAALRDQLEHLGQVRLPAHRSGDLRRGA